MFVNIIFVMLSMIFLMVAFAVSVAAFVAWATSIFNKW